MQNTNTIHIELDVVVVYQCFGDMNVLLVP